MYVNTLILNRFIFKGFFDYLGIKRRTAAENTVVQFKYYDNTERNYKVGASHIGKVTPKEVREKISNSQKGKPKPLKGRAIDTCFKPNNIPWNKDKVGLQHWTDEQFHKYQTTMSKKGWFGTKPTKNEINVYNDLIKQYSINDIVCQYYDKDRYPFKCDFYIKSVDLFIEVNAHWTHGGMPFDGTNPHCIEQLKIWKEKSKTSKFYQNAITTWTVRDVRKQQIAIENHLNYKTIY